jgi:hypothetical protein
MKHFEMDLRDNAYDFVNESLRAAVRADRHARAWKFATIRAQVEDAKARTAPVQRGRARARARHAYGIDSSGLAE